MGNIENLIDKGDYNLALKVIDETLCEDEYNIEILTLKAQVLSKLKEYNKAITIYHSLINLIPREAENYAARGLTYHAMGQQKQTLADFTTAIELEPENGYRYASRAFIKDYLGDYPGALEDYNKALEIDREDAISLNNRGLIEEKLARKHLSQESFARADELAGIDNQTHNPLPQVKQEVDNKENKINLKFFIGTVKHLLTSASERRKFFDFLLKRK